MQKWWMVLCSTRSRCDSSHPPYQRRVLIWFNIRRQHKTIKKNPCCPRLRWVISAVDQANGEWHRPLSGLTQSENRATRSMPQNWNFHGKFTDTALKKHLNTFFKVLYHQELTSALSLACHKKNHFAATLLAGNGVNTRNYLSILQIFFKTALNHSNF